MALKQVVGQRKLKICQRVVNFFTYIHNRVLAGLQKAAKFYKDLSLDLDLINHVLQLDRIVCLFR